MTKPDPHVFSREVVLIFEDRNTGDRRPASKEELRQLLSEIGLEIVPIGTVNWGEHPDQAVMEAKVADLLAKIVKLTAAD